VDDIPDEDIYFFKEFVLWALVEYKKLSKYHMNEGLRFKDVYGGYISGL
jgi:magnesium chelatase subunit I